MRTVFVDSNYWIALLHPQDDLHERAKTVSASLGEVQFVASEMVLAELLNYFGGRGPRLRRAAAILVEQLQHHPDMTIVPQTSDLFARALALYVQRGDKTWSLTDCSSFLIMEEMQMREALTYDRHFEQAGFQVLLR